MGSVYVINKGVNKSVEFRGLKGQYIWYLGGALVVLLIVYATLYFVGLNAYLALAITVTVGVGLIAFVYRLSNRFGEHGLMKAMAKGRIPKTISVRSRTIFKAIKLK